MANCGKANERVFFCEYYSSVLPSGIQIVLKKAFSNLPAQIKSNRKIIGHPFLRCEVNVSLSYVTSKFS